MSTFPYEINSQFTTGFSAIPSIQIFYFQSDTPYEDNFIVENQFFERTFAITYPSKNMIS